jgi:hypothetical protein
MQVRPGMRLIVVALLVVLAGCAAEPLPPVHLVDAETQCEHLRQDAPDAYLSCINEVSFTNEMRIESRQRYLNDAATEAFAPAPPAPAPFVPEPADSMMLPTPSSSSPALAANLDCYGYLRQPPQSSSASVRSPYLGAATRMACGWAASNHRRTSTVIASGLRSHLFDRPSVRISRQKRNRIARRNTKRSHGHSPFAETEASSTNPRESRRD